MFNQCLSQGQSFFLRSQSYFMVLEYWFSCMQNFNDFVQNNSQATKAVCATKCYTYKKTVLPEISSK